MLRKLMLLAAMVAMVLAVASPAMAQVDFDVDAQTSSQEATATGGDATVTNEDIEISESECVAILNAAQAGDAQAANQIQSAATNSVAIAAQFQYQGDDSISQEAEQYCVDVVNSFNTTTAAPAASTTTTTGTTGG